MSYKGVDLSQPALALATQNLARLGLPRDARRSRLHERAGRRGARDAIYSSFAQHHLTTQGNANFFRLAAKRLNTEGLLILVDVTREEVRATKPICATIASGYARL